MKKGICGIAVFLLVCTTGYYGNQCLELQEELRIANSVIEVQEAHLRSITGPPHKWVRPHLRKDGKIY